MAKTPPKAPEIRDTAISVRVRKSLHAAVKEAATEDGRTIAQYVERLLEAHLKDLGKLK